MTINLNQRRCRHCGATANIIRTQRILARESVSLDCGHTCIYLLEGPAAARSRGDSHMTYNGRGVERKCVVDGHTYTTFADDTYGKFCMDCRRIFGITTDREAKVVMEEIDKLSSDERLALRKKYEEAPPVRSIAIVGTSSSAITRQAPAIDKEKVAAAMRAMMEYGRLVHDITAETPLLQPTTFVIAKNGLFEVRNTDIAQIIIQPKEVAGLTTEMKPGIKFNLPLIPYEMLQQTVAFFRETCKRQNGSSEAYLQIWWNTQNEEFTVHVPDQRVSGGSVAHTGEFDRDQARTEDGMAIWLHVMDIHSHGSSMSGFWSSVDDNDEKKAPEGRLFGVIGKVNSPIPDWRWRIRSREGFIDLRVEDLFDIAADHKLPFEVTWRTLLTAASEKDGLTTDGAVRLAFKVDPFKESTCPEEWHTKVNSYQRGGSHHYSGQSASRWEPGQGYTNSLIYIRTENGKELIEFEVDKDGNQKATGKKLHLIDRSEETPNVH